MRLVIAVLMCVALASGTAYAQDGAGRGGPNMLARLLGGLLEKAGATLSGDDNELEPIIVDGTGNEVIRIDELVLNINIGDVSFTREGGGMTMDGPWRERMREMFERRRMDEGMHGMRGPHPPVPTPTYPPGMGAMPPEQPGPRGFRDRPELRPELLEMMMNIPPEVEPAFVGWMMHVGQLAWEYPEFRERLEELVMRAEERLGR